jgi:hypothetical protein
MARRRQGVAGDLEGGHEEGAGQGGEGRAHRNGGSTVRQCKRRRAAKFVSGEGAPVVTGGGDEVLQLRRGEGVRDLQEISGIGCLGGAHRWVADDGGARPESARERGLPVAGGGGPGAGSGGEARALERSRSGLGTGGRVEHREWGASGLVATRQRGKRREKVGVPGVGAPRGVGVPWGLAPPREPRARVPAGQSGGERGLMGGPRHNAGRQCR